MYPWRYISMAAHMFDQLICLPQQIKHDTSMMNAAELYFRFYMFTKYKNYYKQEWLNFFVLRIISHLTKLIVSKTKAQTSGNYLFTLNQGFRLQKDFQIGNQAVRNTAQFRTCQHRLDDTEEDDWKALKNMLGLTNCGKFIKSSATLLLSSARIVRQGELGAGNAYRDIGMLIYSINGIGIL